MQMEEKNESKIKRLLFNIGVGIAGIVAAVASVVGAVGLVVIIYALKFAIPVAVILTLLKLFDVI